jgi:uncharacterized protein
MELLVFVGIMQFELLIRQSRSLKDKRRVVRSVRDKLHREHLVSIAETNALDHQQLAVMGISLVANSASYINSVFDAIIEKLRNLRDAELGDSTRTVFSGDQPPGTIHDNPPEVIA